MSNEQLIEKMRQYGITPYCYQILKCTASGMMEKQTAAELGCSITSVNMMKTRLRRLNGFKSNLQMFVHFAKEGLL